MDEIEINLRLPFLEGKSSLIFQFHPLHNSQMGLPRDFREDSLMFSPVNIYIYIYTSICIKGKQRDKVNSPIIFYKSP